MTRRTVEEILSLRYYLQMEDVQMQSNEHEPQKKQVLLREGLFHLPTSPGEKPYLIGSRCRACGNVFFPQRAVCPACISDDTLEETPLSTRGRINSFAVVQVAPAGFVAPYIQALVDLPEGLTIFSLIAGGAPEEQALEMGAEVELTVEPISVDENGNEVMGYKFRLPER